MDSSVRHQPSRQVTQADCHCCQLPVGTRRNRAAHEDCCTRVAESIGV